jgi:hypothetical protein
MTTEKNHEIPHKENKKIWNCLEYILKRQKKTKWLSTKYMIKHHKKNITEIEDILKKCTYSEIDGEKGNFYNRSHVEAYELFGKILEYETKKWE